MNKLFISPLAQDDLLEIKQYIINELENPISANKIISNITKRFRDLILFPESGALLSSILKFETGYRFIVIGSYIAFYRFDNHIIYIDRVLYGKRDFIRILFSDNFE